jgi:hypothetical protein
VRYRHHHYMGCYETMDTRALGTPAINMRHIQSDLPSIQRKSKKNLPSQ